MGRLHVQVRDCDKFVFNGFTFVVLRGLIEIVGEEPPHDLQAEESPGTLGVVCPQLFDENSRRYPYARIVIPMHGMDGAQCGLLALVRPGDAVHCEYENRTRLNTRTVYRVKRVDRQAP